MQTVTQHGDVPKIILKVMRDKIQKVEAIAVGSDHAQAPRIGSYKTVTIMGTRYRIYPSDRDWETVCI